MHLHIYVYILGGSTDFDDAQYKVCLAMKITTWEFHSRFLKTCKYFWEFLAKYSPITYPENWQMDP